MSRPGLASCSLLTLAALLVASPAAAQRESQPATPPSAEEWLESCRRDGGWNDDDEAHCEVREYTIAAPSRLRVDAGANGGIRVRGTDRRDVFIRAKIRTHARDAEAARELARELKIVTAGGDVRTDAPSGSLMRRRGWSVSYEIWVPRSMNLDLESTNGGVRIAEVRGTLDAETTNGGVHLTDVAGTVHARATNGGITVQIAQSRWEGTGLDAETTNGGVRVELPEQFNGRLEAETTNGGITTDFPITLQGRIGRRISTTLGQGGPLVRLSTTNGGVQIRKR
ncbi:MAG TPA: DUF4097 family beta strand repeat-containing protein [Gemmatimonadaceae bacterium]|nr:DUF4097 family beta strand repeat-containing protein [Gemmatimonadaceae bacterium]